jgi:hypothetical protein
MLKSRNIILVILFFLSLFFVMGCTRQNLPAAEKPVDLGQLKQNYQNQVKQIVANLDTQSRPAVVKAKENLLNLSVPAEFKDLHLSLVLTLEKIQSGLATGEKNELDQAQVGLNKLIQQYPWLKS